MPIASLVFATLAALLHVVFWVLESLKWHQPATWKRFGAKNQTEANAIAPMAYNQGFYNLFLALGALVGVALAVDARGGTSDWDTVVNEGPSAVAMFVQEAVRQTDVANTLIAFTMMCMLGAALVLVISNRKMARAAAIQGTAPALALLIALLA